MNNKKKDGMIIAELVLSSNSLPNVMSAHIHFFHDISMILLAVSHILTSVKFKMIVEVRNQNFYLQHNIFILIQLN